MTTAIEYALMAGASYISNRATVNRIPAPDVWLESIIDRKTTDSGFEATNFVGFNNEVATENGVRLGLLHEDAS